MNDSDLDNSGFNRRDFLRGGSVATLMTMLGGVELFAQSSTPAAGDTKTQTARIKVAVIGLGGWGREIVNTLARLPQTDLAAICDHYPKFLTRAAEDAPGAQQTKDYKTILEDKQIKAVIVATPTPAHKDIVLDALKAGKHVYCEAPLANSIEDAREIALAAKAAKYQLFQAGLQLRSDPERHFLVPFIRSGALGQWVMVRAQWHKKQTWRATAPNPERDKAMNWRLSKETSLGLIGEIGCHQLDQANWFLNRRPIAVTGFGGILRPENNDGRDVPDTIQAIFEYPSGVNFIYDATLNNSFDAEYSMFYGTDSAVMLREDKAWLFKEVDSIMLGWEVYASKEVFYKETGIALVANASKSVKTEKAGEPPPFTNTPLAYALETFLRNGIDVEAARSDAQTAFKDDQDAINEQIAGVLKRPAAGYLEGFQATVLSIKANEAILGRKRVELKPELYELT